MKNMSSTALIDRLAAADGLPQRISSGLAIRRLRTARRYPMSPQLSYGRHAGPAPHTARAAAVILLLYQRAKRWHLPLTERPSTLVHHAGQISLPGGRVERGETSSAAALRELHEELGIDEDVILLGRMPKCYVFASDYLITPWIAEVRHDPVWRPQAEEVQHVIELPIEALLDQGNIGSLTIERGPLVFHAPCLRVGETRVWGATSIILSELTELLHEVL
jgi:8-oxo-dGTP pyrophosphatase MutT (NUDIX family)